MAERKSLLSPDIDALWADLTADITTEASSNYHVSVQLNAYATDVDIVSSPGGGEEGGYSFTRFHTSLAAHEGFQFVLFPEDFLNRLGKLFGMQDVIIGYAEFDAKVIVKTNNAERLKEILADEEVRNVFTNLSGYSLKLDDNDEDGKHYLDLNIQRAVNDPGELKAIFYAYNAILQSL